MSVNPKYIRILKGKIKLLAAAFTVLAIIIIVSSGSCKSVRSHKYIVGSTVLENESYTNPILSHSLFNVLAEISLSTEIPREYLLTAGLIINDFSYKNLEAVIWESFKSQDDYNDFIKHLNSVNKNNKDFENTFNTLISVSKGIINDFKYFPIALQLNGNTKIYSFSDSWHSDRSYGGERKHEGCDIMTEKNVRGYYPVVSISDGVVEKKGWLELGGYRLYIRTESGLHIYYAHLASYDDKIQEGTTVKAGQLLGYAGDTGYSKVEGTTGNFDVHLHVGIYFPMNSGDDIKDIAINPYYIMKNLEGSYIKYDY